MSDRVGSSNLFLMKESSVSDGPGCGVPKYSDLEVGVHERVGIQTKGPLAWQMLERVSMAPRYWATGAA